MGKPRSYRTRGGGRAYYEPSAQKSRRHTSSNPALKQLSAEAANYLIRSRRSQAKAKLGVSKVSSGKKFSQSKARFVRREMQRLKSAQEKREYNEQRVGTARARKEAARAEQRLREQERSTHTLIRDPRQDLARQAKFDEAAERRRLTDMSFTNLQGPGRMADTLVDQLLANRMLPFEKFELIQTLGELAGSAQIGGLYGSEKTDLVDKIIRAKKLLQASQQE